jgi:L-cysteine/cystine lyase
MFQLRERVRAAIGVVLAAPPERIAVTSSTTDGCNIVLAGLGLSPDDEIVTTDQEHFGLAGPVFASGGRVRVARVSNRTGEDLVETIAAEVTERTKLLAVSHVLWTNGHVVDVHALRERTNVPILVDGAQSVGAIAVDVGDLDFYTVSCQKWLCGPEPTGALYVRDPERLRVALPTYFSQQSLERDGTFVPKPGALRFDFGWLATPALAGLEVALDSAPPTQFERAAELARRGRALLAERFEVIRPEAAGTLVSFVAPGEAAEDTARLYDAGVIVRDLPGTGWLRASCGWWNDESDLERLLTAL